MADIVNRPYAKAFETFASARPDILCLSADLTSSCEVDGFRDKYPDQFLSLGMAEQNMLSFAGGLAMQGFRPFLHTFSVFLYRRPYDQLINSIAYSNRKVRLMGFLPGITTPGGITHQAIEDISVMRAIPNMTILECGDATEVETVLEVADSIDGPVYVRVLRGEVPRLFSTPFEFNRQRTLSEGDDVLVVTAGVCTEEALRAAGPLKARGIGIHHLHVSTLKPFDREGLIKAARGKKGVVTLENPHYQRRSRLAGGGNPFGGRAWRQAAASRPAGYVRAWRIQAVSDEEIRARRQRPRLCHRPASRQEP